MTTSAGVASPSAAASTGDTKPRFSTWLAPVTAMTFVLGAFIGLALKTQNAVDRAALPSSRFSTLAEAYIEMKRSMMAYQATINNLQKTNEVLTDQAAAGDPQLKVLTDQVKQAQFVAGLTDVTGPGVVVTLNDSKMRAPANLPASLSPQIMADYLIHDVDLQRVLNELKAGGAEAFAINGERIVTNTAVRCVGPAIQVNGIPIAPPYNVQAIGDPDTLMTVMNMQGGISDQLKRTDPAMIAVSKRPKMLIKAYDGATQFRYAKPVFATSASVSASGN
jgi:uncharacterized protein YlxW (UPF0749 family)